MPRDHPRVCGEKRWGLLYPARLRGSPPRVRGKVFRYGVSAGRLGITPAYAGKSRTSVLLHAAVWDHPRVCGEKAIFQLLQAVSGWITPAYAGKRSCKKKRETRKGDHPRVCGEKWRQSVQGTNLQGSPPRMRGKAVRESHTSTQVGITPAYAGKSDRHHKARGLWRDHPRVCGEKAAILRAVCVPMGSPPRMRGKGLSWQWLLLRHRITPAYAGKRHCLSTARNGKGDHPRVCGEKTKKIP